MPRTAWRGVHEVMRLSSGTLPTPNIVGEGREGFEVPD